MDSISNTFTTFYATENIGEVQIGQANLQEILAAIFTEVSIMKHSVKTVGTSTPQGAFHSIILEGLNVLGYSKILEETVELVNYIDNPKFGSSMIGDNLRHMVKRSKEDFDIRFDLSFAEFDQTLDECKLSLMIKAHRLFLAELCKKISRSYVPTDIDPSKAVYRKFAGEATQIRNGKQVTVPKYTEHSSVEFVDYATLLKSIYTRVYAYSDTLSEFTKIFVTAAAASKKLATKMTESRHAKTIAEQRGSPKMGQPQNAMKPKPKPKPFNDASVKVGPIPLVNSWSQRQSEFELAKDLVAVADVAVADIAVADVAVVAVVAVADVADVADVAEDVVDDVVDDDEFIKVSRKNAAVRIAVKTTKPAKTTKTAKPAKTVKTVKTASRSETLTAIAS